MIKILLILSVLSILVYCGSDSGEEAQADQVAKIEVTVTNAANGEPVQGMKVALEVLVKMSVGTRTNPGGAGVQTSTANEEKLTLSNGMTTFTFTNLMIPTTNYITLKRIKVIQGVTVLYDEAYTDNVSDGNTKKYTIPIDM